MKLNSAVLPVDGMGTEIYVLGVEVLSAVCD